MSGKIISSTMLLVAAVFVLSLASCDPGKKEEKRERERINEYLSAHPDQNFVKTPDGLYYYEILAGTGNSPVEGDSVVIKYSGKFLDGNQFDASNSVGFIVGVNISGFDEGLEMMKVGGKAMLLIPSELGYGSYGKYPFISGYTPLLFDIELLKLFPQEK